MKASRCAVFSLLIASCAFADGPVFRRDLWSTQSPWAGGAQTVDALHVDPQGVIHGTLSSVGYAYAADFDGSLKYLFSSPALGTKVTGNSFVRDDATGEVAVLLVDGLTVVVMDSFGQEEWRAVGYPGAVGTIGGLLLHPSGDFLATSGAWGTGRVFFARISRTTHQPLWTQSVSPVAPTIAGCALDPSGNLITGWFTDGGFQTLVMARANAATGAITQTPMGFGTWGCAAPMTLNGVLNAIATDSSGNFYLAGQVNTSAPTGFEGLVLKLDASFNPVWCSSQNQGGTWSEEWYAIAVSGSGQIAVTGTRTSGTWDMLTALLDANGNAIWIKSEDESGQGDVGNTVVFEPSGNVLVGGGMTPLLQSTYHPTFIRYDSAGNRTAKLVWHKNEEQGSGVAVDSAGSIYVAGLDENTSRLVVSKFGSTGNRIWTSESTAATGEVHRIKVDASGNSYVVAKGTSAAWLVEKRTSAGTVSWQKTGPYTDTPTDLDFTPGGDIVVGATGRRLVQYTASGTEVRNAVIAWDASPLVVHGSGEITAAGAYKLTHVSSTFTPLWQATTTFSSAYDLALDSAGEIYLSGTLPSSDFAIARYGGTNGSLVWLRNIPSSSAGPDPAMAIAVEPGGHVLAVGEVDGWNRILRYHTSGTLVYDGAFEIPTTSWSRIEDVVVYGGGTTAALVGRFPRSSDDGAFLLKWSLTALGSPGPRRITTGEGPGSANSNTVRMYDGAGVAAGTVAAYGANAYGTNVAAGNINVTAGDEQLTGPGPGAVFGPQVKAFTGPGSTIAKVNFYAYGTLKYGVMVGAARLDADVSHEILTGPGPGPVFGPQVRGFNFDGAALTAIAKINYYAYGTLKYGVNVGGGDLDGDGYDEILTGPGPGGVFGPQVRGFQYDGATIVSMGKVNFNAFSSGMFGVNVAGADLEPDGYGEILAGRGPGAGLACEIATYDFDGTTIAGKGSNILVTTTTLYGANVGGGDLDGNGAGEMIGGVGDDPAGAGRLRAYQWVGTTYLSVPTSDFLATPSMCGVNVAIDDLE